MLKALGNPIRFQIVEHLASNETCITNGIVRTLPLARSTNSPSFRFLAPELQPIPGYFGDDL